MAVPTEINLFLALTTAFVLVLSTHRALNQKYNSAKKIKCSENNNLCLAFEDVAPYLTGPPLYAQAGTRLVQTSEALLPGSSRLKYGQNIDFDIGGGFPVSEGLAQVIMRAIEDDLGTDFAGKLVVAISKQDNRTTHITAFLNSLNQSTLAEQVDSEGGKNNLQVWIGATERERLRKAPRNLLKNLNPGFIYTDRATRNVAPHMIFSAHKSMNGTVKAT